MTPEKTINSILASVSQLRKLIVDSPGYLRAFRPGERSDIFHHINQITMLSNNVLKAVEGMRRERAAVTNADGKDKAGKVGIVQHRPAGDAQTSKIKRLEARVAELEKEVRNNDDPARASSMDRPIIPLIDLLDQPNDSGSGAIDPFCLAAIVSDYDLLSGPSGIVTSTSESPSGPDDEMSIDHSVSAGGELLSCEDHIGDDVHEREVGIEIDRPVMMIPEGNVARKQAVRTAMRISNHNAIAKRENSSLPTGTSHLSPLWDHHTSTPMRQALLYQPQPTFDFPLMVQDAWTLDEEDVEYLIKRLRIPDLMGYAEWGLDRKRRVILRFCGIQDAETYEVWESDQVPRSELDGRA